MLLPLEGGGWVGVIYYDHSFYRGLIYSSTVSSVCNAQFRKGGGVKPLQERDSKGPPHTEALSSFREKPTLVRG